MFQNNNKKIVKHLACKSFLKDKQRNLMSIITVIIAIGMIMALALLPIETLKAKKIEEEKTPQAAFTNVTQSSVSKIKKSAGVEWVGEKIIVCSTKMADYTINTMYINQPMLNASKLTLKGKMPVKANEILLAQSFLRHINSKAKTGDSVSLDLGKGQKRYNITGILYGSSVANRNYAAIVSKDFIQGEKGNSLKASVYVHMKNTDKSSEDDLDNAIYSLADKNGISKNNVSIGTSAYRIQKSNNASNTLGLAALFMVILFGAGLVIYSIFYISVTGKVHQYGQLRTIGATKKQIKGIVHREGLIISAIGVPMGIMLGSIVGYFLIPKGWVLMNTLCIAAAICIIGFISVFISIRTPAKIAANTSAIEATRYTTYQGKVVRKKSQHITPLRFAIKNLSRNRKKTVLTLLSLGFSGILLLCAATMAVSYSAIDNARPEFPYGTYKISLAAQNLGNDDFAVSRIQANTPLNGHLKNKLLAIKGVKKVKEWSSTPMSYKLPNGRESNGAAFVYAFSSNEIQKMKAYVTKGKLDYHSMMLQRGIAVCYPQSYKETYGWDPKIGDKVKVTLLNNKGKTVKKTLTVAALLKGNYRQVGPYIWMPVKLMNQLSGMKDISDFEIVTGGQDKAAIESSLKSITNDNPYLGYDSLKNMTKELQKGMQPTFNVIYILIVFISLFGIINLVNTSITNLLSRKREIGILQAIGLTNRQLNRMLKFEGLLYTAGTMVLTLTLGTAFGYATYRILKALGMALHYHYPVIPVSIFAITLLVIQIIISTFSIRYLKKQTLIERIQGV